MCNRKKTQIAFISYFSTTTDMGVVSFSGTWRARVTWETIVTDYHPACHSCNVSIKCVDWRREVNHKRIYINFWNSIPSLTHGAYLSYLFVLLHKVCVCCKSAFFCIRYNFIFETVAGYMYILFIFINIFYCLDHKYLCAAQLNTIVAVLLYFIIFKCYICWGYQFLVLYNLIVFPSKKITQVLDRVHFVLIPWRATQ